ncbi:exodeoxyribonuclease I [Agaribacterium sp. ZY112]|uniref:exodeoxyribonuclease I n=1 Tax=Agaribacterium sp. ZY112 TaxID=3233574 RepID=UPI0035254A0F
MATLYWHDYESWGANPAIDRPSQFAGVRTDKELNIIGEPLVLFCKPPEDILPHPEACLVTGISPQKAQEHGLNEAEFISAIHRELALPGTVGVGYNSLRFDDEMTRYTLFRNFYDPYEREWRNGNSRWDIIDMMRLVYALRPEGFEWPKVDGKPSFKLELLTAANGITHSAAHDAFSDVEATIALARLVKDKQPNLYDYLFEHRTKRAVSNMIDIRARKPLLHISSMFSTERGCAGLIVPLAAHPKNNNAVICYDLSVDPTSLDVLDAEAIRERIFSKQEDLPEGVQRLPIKLVHLNKCPVLLPTRMLNESHAERLGIDRHTCEAHWQRILPMELEYKLRQVFADSDFEGREDPEQQLYEGFISDVDKTLSRLLRDKGADAFDGRSWHFEDTRLNGFVNRYQARNHPETLSPEQRLAWLKFVKHRLQEGEPGLLSLSALELRVSELMLEREGDPRAQHILSELSAWADLKRQSYFS